MCKMLKISKSKYYYQRKKKEENIELRELIKAIFQESRNNYGTRKIRHILKKYEYYVSRKTISRIMKEEGLVSNYTLKQYKVHKGPSNTEEIPNIVDRKFDNRPDLDVIVSDLTYVSVLNRWYYICIIIDLFNREIIGYASGGKKNAELIYEAFRKIQYGLSKINIFHSDRGKEFDNKIIDKLLGTFTITRSLSEKGCPYDNAVAEATFKILKTEFAYNRRFNSSEELERELFDYVNWYNNIRIHGSLNYQTPMAYRQLEIARAL